ncbi:MAG: FtsX-like permease family protein, partial [Muribaculaceae bacterium]|nr:FtsX-like permease family protein [Muribaculaceae bacterium]
YSGENGNNIPLLITPIDANFFKIYDFDFVAGRALTKDEFDGNEKVIILSDRTATELFGNPADCIGRIIKISFIDYKVIGVVREPSNIMMSYAMGYVPYSAVRDKLMSSNEIVGGYYVVAIPKKGVTHKQISDDFSRCMQPVISANSGIDLEIKTFDRPVSHFTRTFGDALSADATYLWYLAAVILVLLIVPAMNLSGMIVGRMEQRRSEMGIRKSFGATRGVLLGQVLTENLLLTFLGAAAGLILSWVLISSFGRIIFDLLGGADEIPDNTRLTPDMLFSPIIFATVAVMTLILNLLSSYIPVRRALRKPIVESLNNQR